MKWYKPFFNFNIYYMFIKEYEYIEIILKPKQIKRWIRILGFQAEPNTKLLVHWTKIKGTTFRRKKVQVKCDSCYNICEKDSRYLDVNINYHLCGSCYRVGQLNPMFGKKASEKNKQATKKWMEERGNPFTWDSVKIIINEKKEESLKKRLLKVIGSKRTDETKKKMSDSMKLAYKTGVLKSGKGFYNIRCEYYKDIIYQGTYELRFLKFIESYGKLDLITRGPRIPYIIDGVEHTYMCDYMIKNTNIIFEIKSSYYWKKNEDINIIKKSEAEKLYNYNLIINNNFENIKKYFI